MSWMFRRLGDSGDGSEGYDGRFVVHEHVDVHGEHVDIRLEAGSCLIGWRMRSLSELKGRLKALHPLRWLDVDVDNCKRVDGGEYRIVSRQVGGIEIEFAGDRLSGHFEAKEVISGGDGLVEGLVEELRAELEVRGPDVVLPGSDADFVMVLMRDGLNARRDALERMCSLGRDLDGDAFPESFWRERQSSLSVSDMKDNLALLERRFNEKYPPRPLSVREDPGVDAEADERIEKVKAILSS
ncbi:hypothetical protein ACFL1X_03320 [Candidatus Hydrogenedentota bacterium]